MTSLMEPPSPPTASSSLPVPLVSHQHEGADTTPPINTYHLTRPIGGTATELVIQTFDDRILVIVTQNQKIGILTQASIPQVAQLPHPPPASSSSAPNNGSIPNLPPPPPGLSLTPLLGSPRPDEQALYDLYVSQIATLVWWTLNETRSMRRPVVVGLALGKLAAGDDGDEDVDVDVVQRERFGEILKMVIGWPGPQ